MSCNGCRVLRKGCSDDCVIRPCLEWINSPQSQANATIFLAKFYGRVGLINLINTAPNHLRQDVFRSLLYEACGRIINPIHGSAGLLWTGNWRECQSAVDSVLKGSATFITNSAQESTKPPYGHVIQHEANSVSSSWPRSHRSSGGANGAVKLELSLGVIESSPVADSLAADQGDPK